MYSRPSNNWKTTLLAIKYDLLSQVVFNGDRFSYIEM